MQLFSSSWLPEQWSQILRNGFSKGWKRLACRECSTSSVANGVFDAGLKGAQWDGKRLTEKIKMLSEVRPMLKPEIHTAGPSRRVHPSPAILFRSCS